MRTNHSLLRQNGRPRSARLAAVVLLAATALLARPRPGGASSDFDTGRLDQTNPVTGRTQELGVCRLFIGPRDFIEAGEFLLEIGEVQNGTGEVQQLVGTATPDGEGSYFLRADDAEAEDFYQQVLRQLLSRPDFAFQLTGLEVEVFKSEFDRGPQDISCEMRMYGFVVGSSNRPPTTIVPRTQLARIGIGTTAGTTSLVYAGAGVLYPGVADDVASQQIPTATTQDVDCPRPNFAPVPDKCDPESCLVTFAGYQWWTEYEYWGPNGGYFYNNNNAWSPKNVTVDDEGLHLFVRMQDVGAGETWTAGEAVTALKLDGSLASFGYGTYLVTARVKTAPTWDAMDPNVAFGAFTYERDKTGNTDNPGREIDLAELSRWGRVDGVPCKNIPLLCTGNAQFTLQEWWKLAANVNRYTIGQSGPTVTLVMEWNGANQPVTFKQFEGAKTLDDDLGNPAYTWTTYDNPDNPDDPKNQNKYIPASRCEQFHLNLWMGNHPAAVNGYNPPPASPQEVVVTNFQFRPK